jgi:hypothetical protein
MVKVVREEVMWCARENSKKPPEIYIYMPSTSILLPCQQNTFHNSNTSSTDPMQYTQVAIFLMSANQELPLVTFTEQPMPHLIHQIEGNNGFSL